MDPLAVYVYYDRDGIAFKNKAGLWIRIRMDLHSFSLLDSLIRIRIQYPDPGG